MKTGYIETRTMKTGHIMTTKTGDIQKTVKTDNIDVKTMGTGHLKTNN
jgi:hypothetical protein